VPREYIEEGLGGNADVNPHVKKGQMRVNGQGSGRKEGEIRGRGKGGGAEKERKLYLYSSGEGRFWNNIKVRKD